jgi:hypothetical protein
VVVAEFVTIGEERLSRVLCTCQAKLDAIVVVELIADIVSIAITQITVFIAFALVEGNLGTHPERVFSVFGYVFPLWPDAWGFLFTHIDKAFQQLTGMPVQLRNHHELTQ